MTEKIGIAADHGGKELKRLVHDFLRLTDVEVVDFGVPYESQASVDYPDFARLLAGEVSTGKLQRGVAICGTGLGMSIVANKFSNVRATLVWDEFTARMSRLHNDSNIICLGARTTNHHRAVDFLKIWLETPYEGGRHNERLRKILDTEKLNLKPRG
jgi:ribose 5-phosphate isomerase B